jgi:hypothetical protein
MKSETEKRKTQAPQQRIRGFFPFIVGANVEGTLEACKIKDDGRGFFIVKATKSAIVNVQDEDSKTGQGKAQIGELVGIRKTGATKILRDLPLGTLVSVTYVGLEERVGVNPKTQLEENNPYHHITIDVYRPDSQEGNS